MPIPYTKKTNYLNTMLRRKEALELRKLGFTYREIADGMITKYADKLPPTYDERYAYRDVKQEINEIVSETKETAREVIELELQRLDELFNSVFQKAIGGDMKAVDRVLRIQERRSKLLGLDKPQQIKVDDWRSQLLDLLESGAVSVDDIRKEFGEVTVRELLPNVSKTASVEENIIDAEIIES